ncbi:MAG: peptide chain release factor 3, partial [Gammaproteobacteria bacterium]|nr:peptide chain release factor 3 [Gammaproteobacteria bacterium]
QCSPVTWPVGMGRELKGLYHIIEDRFYPRSGAAPIDGLDNPALDEVLGMDADALREEIELVQGASHEFDLDAYLAGKLTPVFFGSALAKIGVTQMLDSFVKFAPLPQPRGTLTREVEPAEPKLSGFVFKIQANMDPAHHDRIAFLRLCSGTFRKGMRLRHVRAGKDIKVHDALTFFASEREHVQEAHAGDIIGLHNHGTISIGDTFTEGEPLQFTGIPNFAPELFRRAVLRDPLRAKALSKGLDQLCEEGATQVFRPLRSNDVILGAIGVLQFEVVEHRLRTEYKVESSFEGISVATARWVHCADHAKLDEFRRKAEEYLALDHKGGLVYIAPTMVNLHLAMERHPDIEFRSTREQWTGEAAA